MASNPNSATPGCRVVATPIQIPAGSHDPRRELRRVEASTAVTAVELGIRPTLFGWGLAPGPLREYMLEGRRLVGWPEFQPRGQALTINQTPRRPPVPKDGQEEDLSDTVYHHASGQVYRVPHPRAAVKQQLPPGVPLHEALTETAYGKTKLRDNSYEILQSFLPEFSSTGLCLRWNSDEGRDSCTLLFQKTRFDETCAEGMTTELSSEVDRFRERWLLGGPNPLVCLEGDLVDALLPGGMNWVGEFQLRSPQQTGGDCKRCDKRPGHCLVKIFSVIHGMRRFPGPINLDFMIHRGFSMDPSVPRHRAHGYLLRLRISTRTPPEEQHLDEWRRWIGLQAREDGGLLREHRLGKANPAATIATAVGAPLGPSIPGLESRPLTLTQVVRGLPWPRR